LSALLQNSPPAIVWFRDDLRVADNPALNAACATGQDVICVYIYEKTPSFRGLGGAAKWWLHNALAALSHELIQLGSKLHIVQGDAATIIPALVASTKASHVFWNRRYNLAEREADAALKLKLTEAGVAVQSLNGHLLYEPWEVTTKTGTPCKVFTPFWRAARAVRPVAAPLSTPECIRHYGGEIVGELNLDSLNLLPTTPDWSGGMNAEWQPTEAGARARLLDFLDTGIKGYSDNRNLPAQTGTSKLSPYLRFGQISVRQIWAITQAHVDNGALNAYENDVRVFQSELGWREFSYHLLFHFPHLPTQNYQPKFDKFPWVNDAKGLNAWQRGQTGYPIVDAGMRQLWQTGWMHNRVRMIVGSFLIKHLMIDWREGEAWFWDTLCDADVASNAASWQWVAGSGADASPYYRIFNPMLQGEKFDTDGEYVKRFVPELAGMPKQYVHKPWEAPLSVLASAGVKLSKTYPHPIVDHVAARNRALEFYKSIGAGDA
jgi:deoxyribodipyrimidine photo-lyase